jgi:Holliday junction resolvase RusA-like endonuclease
MKLIIKGIPKPKQSVRSRIVKTKTGKSFVQHYQTKEVKQNEQNLAFDVKSQLPPDFVPFSGAVHVKKILYVFPPQKGWPKYKLQELEQGKIFYKQEKPDLTDNLNKPLFDALQGIVFLNDSLICKISNVEKIYGLVPRIELELEAL